ncbi:hypothetical protein BDZ45DRAFT_742793 [Acephala macrosclerotiorum]|nr:hypothetical protein BDZ45DRAFT_742793 [Acephala macrosclerotiorum]
MSGNYSKFTGRFEIFAFIARKKWQSCLSSSPAIQEYISERLPSFQQKLQTLPYPEITLPSGQTHTDMCIQNIDLYKCKHRHVTDLDPCKHTNPNNGICQGKGVKKNIAKRKQKCKSCREREAEGSESELVELISRSDEGQACSVDDGSRQGLEVAGREVGTATNIPDNAVQTGYRHGEEPWRHTFIWWFI